MLGAERHKLIYYIGVGLLGFGMMLGTVPTSIPQFILLGNWLLEGRFREKWLALKSNPVFWVLGTLFLWHVLGLAYSSDLKAGLDDVRIKIPLLLLPILFFSSPAITRRELKWILLAFIIGCVVNVSWCLFYYYTKLGNQPIRQASRFMSHIRLSLFLNMAFCAVYWCFTEWRNSRYRWLLLLVPVLFVFTIIKLALMTALVLMVLMGIILGIYGVFKWRSSTTKRMVLVLLAASVLGLAGYVYTAYQDYYHVSDHPNNQVLKTTPSGRAYEPPGDFPQLENGFYVYRNIEIYEVQREWNRRFPEDSFSFVPKTHNPEIGQTLIRYLTSKGLTKDSASVASLRFKDYKLIKAGVSNHLYPEWNPLKKRLYELFFELQELQYNRDVSGHSLSMRFYFWKAAFHIISNNPVFGVGTGDGQKKFNRAYRKLNAPLTKEWYLRSHNQFLAITVAFGIVGLVVFLLSLVFPFYYLRGGLNYLYICFLGIAVFSFLFEDTLESQTGLTFFAYFNTLLLSMAYFSRMLTTQKINVT